MTEHPTTFELKCHFAGTPDFERNEEIVSHLRDCPSCQTVMRQFESAQTELTERKPASLFLQQLETRARNENMKTRKRRYTAVAALAAGSVACGVVGVVMVMMFNTANAPEPQTNPLTPAAIPQRSEMRWMGNGVTAKIHVRRNGETFVSDGERPQNGDQLRYEVNRSGDDKAYASVFAVQDGEVVSLLPQLETQSPYEFTDHLVIPGSVVVEPGGQDVELLLIVQSTPYTLKSVKDELTRRLNENDDLSKINGLVHRLNATPESGQK